MKLTNIILILASYLIVLFSIISPSGYASGKVMFCLRLPFFLISPLLFDNGWTDRNAGCVNSVDETL